MATWSSIFAWKNPMDRGAWQAIVHGVTKSQTCLGTHMHTHASYWPDFFCVLYRYSFIGCSQHAVIEPELLALHIGVPMCQWWGWEAASYQVIGHSHPPTT